MNLRDTANASGLTYGAAISAGLLRDPLFAALARAQCALLVPENEAKWGVVSPTPKSAVFSPLDEIISFSRDNGLSVHGHCFVWHKADPPWLTEELAEGRWREALENHIATEAGRYQGRIVSWDVVNEAVDPGSGRADALRASAWLAAAGPQYIPAAFEAARRAASGAKLAYNDYGVEYATAAHTSKRRAVLALLNGLQRRGLVDAFGIQSHLWLGQPFEASSLRRFLADVSSLGLEIWVSELDVDDRAFTGTEDQRDAAVAAHVRAYLDTVLSEPAVRRVVSWGLSTRYSWLNATPGFARPDGRDTMGLPFDADRRPTGMGRALATAFEGAVRR